MKQILYILIFLVISFIGCKQENGARRELNNTISISIDNRIELLRIAYNLALEDSLEIDLRPCKNNFYKANYESYKKYSNHSLVQKIRSGNEWNADLPTIALCLDENLKPKDSLNINEIIKQFGWYGENLDSLSRLLIDFNKAISFKDNFNVDFKPFKDSIEANEIPKKLNVFFRTDKRTNLKILFDPLNNVTNKAITFLNNPEKERIFLIGYFCDHPDSTSNALKLVWDNDYRRIVVHENSHLYTDKLFQKYYTNELDSLVNQEKFQKGGYNDIDEIVVRGITAKIIVLNYGTEAGGFEIKRLHPNSKIVYDYMDKYIKNDKMEFEQAYKEIIELLKKEYL